MAIKKLTTYKPSENYQPEIGALVFGTQVYSTRDSEKYPRPEAIGKTKNPFGGEVILYQPVVNFIDDTVSGEEQQKTLEASVIKDPFRPIKSVGLNGHYGEGVQLIGDNVYVVKSPLSELAFGERPYAVVIYREGKPASIMWMAASPRSLKQTPKTFPNYNSEADGQTKIPTGGRIYKLPEGQDTITIKV